MANFAGEENYTSKLDQALSAPPTGIAEFFLALNIFLCITASLGNALILVVLKRVSSIHPPMKLYFRCLAVTDLCVGLIVQPLFTTDIMSRLVQMNVSFYFYVPEIIGTLSIMLCGVSVLTSTAISVDRLLALLLGMRYRDVVSLRRVRVVVICIWLIAALSAGLRVWRKDIAYKQASVVVILCLATSIFCYTHIFLKLRHHQAQVQNCVSVLHGEQNGERSPALNIARYEKTVYSIMWVQLALVACYVPWGIAAVLYGNQYFVVWKATSTPVYLNSSLNPVLYCWKIRGVKQAVKGTIRQYSCY